MKQLSIAVNPAVRADLPMRNILGMNNGPRITGKFSRKLQFEAEKKLFDDLNLKYVRFHDAALQNPGMKLLDVSRIFPLFHLDENDPKNYCFAQSDDYLASLVDDQVEIDLRLGESIDHSGFARLIGPPEDCDKWARICRNIVAHYRDGLWDGMHLNINRVTVWEEANGFKLFSGTVQDYSRMYCAVWKLFKKEFPDIRVGGANSSGFAHEFIDEFLAICRDEGVVPDFVPFTRYTRDKKGLAHNVEEVREILKKYGLEGTGIVITEWHQGPTQWVIVDPERDGFTASPNAAFSVSSLISLMDTEDLELAYYYAWGSDVWGVCSLKNGEIRPYAVYHALGYYGQIADTCKERLAVAGDLEDTAEVLAARAEDGKVRVLVSCYETEQTGFNCRVAGATACTMKAIRSDYDEAEATGAVDLEVSADGSVVFSQEKDGSDVFLLEFSVNG